MPSLNLLELRSNPDRRRDSQLATFIAPQPKAVAHYAHQFLLVRRKLKAVGDVVEQSPQPVEADEIVQVVVACCYR
jgi:hypothetical protein